MTRRFPLKSTEPPIDFQSTAIREAAPAGQPEYFYYLKDALGSPGLLTNGDGQPVERYTYTPYGQTQVYAAGGSPLWESAYGNPFAWTGQRYEPATNLYHFWARSYSPVLGRFLQRDPQGPLSLGGGSPCYGWTSVGALLELPDTTATGEYTDSFNLYAYAAARPLIAIDPTGQAMLVVRDFDAIWDSIVGEGSDHDAYLGVQGAATWGAFWGGNVTALPDFAEGMAGVSQGMSDFADFYAEQVIFLPVEGALAGMGSFGSYASVGKAGTKGARYARVAATSRVSWRSLQSARKAAKNFRIPWGRWRHILERHTWGTKHVQVGRFSPGANIKGMIRQAMTSANALIRTNQHKQIGGWVFELRFPQKIGADMSGRVSKVIRVILKEDGRVWTAFPI